MYSDKEEIPLPKKILFKIIKKFGQLSLLNKIMVLSFLFIDLSYLYHRNIFLIMVYFFILTKKKNKHLIFHKNYKRIKNNKKNK